MPEKTTHAPGTFCWPEAAVDDMGKAKAFFGGLFGWDLRDAPGGFYAIAHRKGKAVAGFYALSEDQRKRGIPPHFLSYVRVASADGAAKKASGLGGKVLAPPFDVPTVGRMAVVEDPIGACFAVWEPKGMEGAALVDEPGAPCWYELMASDPAKATAFYTGLFGWKPEAMPMGSFTYTLFKNEGADCSAAGMMPMGPEFGGIPSHWMPYFAVEDCDAVAKECAALGGKVCVPPSDVPNVGRFSVLTAPDGATFSVIRLGK